jgi:hypothetical protein
MCVFVHHVHHLAVSTHHQAYLLGVCVADGTDTCDSISMPLAEPRCGRCYDRDLRQHH